MRASSSGSSIVSSGYTSVTCAGTRVAMTGSHRLRAISTLSATGPDRGKRRWRRIDSIGSFCSAARAGVDTIAG